MGFNEVAACLLVKGRVVQQVSVFDVDLEEADEKDWKCRHRCVVESQPDAFKHGLFVDWSFVLKCGSSLVEQKLQNKSESDVSADTRKLLKRENKKN